MAKPTVDDYFASLTGWQAGVAGRLRAIVKGSLPGVTEEIKWGQPVFDYHGPVCYLRAFERHVNFGFVRGSDLDDADRLLEGSGANMRHVKIAGPDDVDEAALASLIKAAAELNRPGGGAS